MRVLDWEMMPYFLAVARSGTLRSAARLLNVNYGTLNRNIQALENSYGTRLFSRSRTGFTLTEAGHALLPVAEEAEETLQSARRRVEGLDRTESGLIRLSLPHMLAYDIIAPIVAHFQKTYPNIQVELRLTSAIENIAKGETDVGLRGAIEIADDVVARKLYPLGIGVYAHKDYIKDEFSTAGSNGEGLTWIGESQMQETKNQLQQTDFPNADMRHVVADGYMRLSLLRLGCGMAYLPVIFEKVFPEIQRVPGTEVTSGRNLWIVVHEDLGRTVRVRRFVDFLAKELQILKPDMQGALYRK